MAHLIHIGINTKEVSCAIIVILISTFTHVEFILKERTYMQKRIRVKESVRCVVKELVKELSAHIFTILNIMTRIHSRALLNYVSLVMIKKVAD